MNRSDFETTDVNVDGRASEQSTRREIVDSSGSILLARSFRANAKMAAANGLTAAIMFQNIEHHDKHM